MELVTLDQGQAHPDHYRKLEEGGVLFFPKTPFDLPEQDKDFLRSISLADTSYHKNIAYRPAQDKVTGFDKGTVADPERLLFILHTYSQKTLAFLKVLLPSYMEGCRIDYASFRPQEEEGRELPLKKRNDLLHTDAFPTRPTGGDLILRIFTNIHPSKPRVWLTSDPFGKVARQYALDAGLAQIAAGSPLGRLRERLARLTGPARSPYDRFMLRFHDYLKLNQQYQESCPKYRLEFPAGSTWIVFTDIVPHAVLSGQYALEQTVMVRRDALLEPRTSPIGILESLCSRRLA
jgi:hypothetical protein